MLSSRDIQKDTEQTSSHDPVGGIYIELYDALVSHIAIRAVLLARSGRETTHLRLKTHHLNALIKYVE